MQDLGSDTALTLGIVGVGLPYLDSSFRICLWVVVQAPAPELQVGLLVSERHSELGFDPVHMYVR